MRPVHILLVEDNEGDILLTSEAFEEAKIKTHLSYVKDGKEAIDFVTRQGKYANAQLPDLLLLDINIPKRNGVEVLKFMKAHAKLRKIPVIMLTTSSSPEDISRCYENYANCFITKPIEPENYQAIVTQIENFWTSIVTLPVQNGT